MGTAYLDGEVASGATISAWIEGQKEATNSLEEGHKGEYYLQVIGNYEGKREPKIWLNPKVGIVITVRCSHYRGTSG